MNHVKGYEVIIMFTLDDMNNDRIFYTDSNGLDMQRRKLNWKMNSAMTMMTILVDLFA